MIKFSWTFKRSREILLPQLVLQTKYTRATYEKTTQSHKTKTASHKQGWWLGVEGRPAVSSESGCWLRAAGSRTVHSSTLRAAGSGSVRCNTLRAADLLCNTSQCAQLGRSLRAGARPACGHGRRTRQGYLPKRDNFSQPIPIIRLPPKLMRPGLKKMFLMLKNRSLQRHGAGYGSQ